MQKLPVYDMIASSLPGAEAMALAMTACMHAEIVCRTHHETHVSLAATLKPLSRGWKEVFEDKPEKGAVRPRIVHALLAHIHVCCMIEMRSLSEEMRLHLDEGREAGGRSVAESKSCMLCSWLWAAHCCQGIVHASTLWMGGMQPFCACMIPFQVVIKETQCCTLAGGRGPKCVCVCVCARACACTYLRACMDRMLGTLASGPGGFVSVLVPELRVSFVVCRAELVAYWLNKIPTDKFGWFPQIVVCSRLRWCDQGDAAAVACSLCRQRVGDYSGGPHREGSQKAPQTGPTFCVPGALRACAHSRIQPSVCVVPRRTLPLLAP